jgi:hypothetical protein
MTEGIVTILKGDSEIQALIGNNKAGTKVKVYAGIAPQPEDAPYIVVRRTGKTPTPCKGGRPGMDTHRFQVVFYHKNYEGLNNIELAIEAALDQKSGKYEGYTFKIIVLADAYDELYLREHNLHARVMDFEALVNAFALT